MKKMIVSFLLAVVMVFAMATGAMAAEGEQGLRLEVNYSEEGVLLNAYLTAEGLTNGRITVAYDTDKLVLAGMKDGGDDWFTSYNVATAGQVSFAWVGSDLSAEETLMFTLIFTEVEWNSGIGAVYSATVSESYKSGEPAVLEDMTDETVCEERDNPFVDIDESWAKEDILKAYYAGLVNGTGDGEYSPEVEATRGMFVTLLYRLAGEPVVEEEVPFTDVEEGAYYEDAAVWAYTNGITNGTGADTFDPDRVITREEMVTLLYRYAQFVGRDVTAEDDLASFTDVSAVSDWALDAMEWAVADDILEGFDNELMPQGTATRDQLAAMFVRYAGL